MPSTLYKHSGNHMPGSHAGTSRTTRPSGPSAIWRCKPEHQATPTGPSGNAAQTVTGPRQAGDTPLILMKTGQSSVSVALKRRRDQSRAHSLPERTSQCDPPPCGPAPLRPL